MGHTRSSTKTSLSTPCQLALTWYVCELSLTILLATPQTSLTSRAIDGFADEDAKFAVVSDLLRYLHTDTVLFVSPSLDLLRTY